MVKLFLHNGISECILMEVFYFVLSNDTQQTADVVFVGGILKSPYNQIKITLDSRLAVVKSGAMMVLTLVKEKEGKLKE